MSIANERHDQIIRKRVDEQETCKQECAPFSVANSQPQSCESKYRSQQEIGMARNHEIVARDDGGLRRRDPEISGALDGEPRKSRGVLADELANLLLLLGHETEFA